MTEQGGLGLLGLGLRGGLVVVGTQGVRAALRRGELALVVIAADASRRTRDKVVRLAAARGIPVAPGGPAVRLGRAMGRSTVQAVGVRDRALAAAIAARQDEV